ncbi:MAG: putative Ig domain-containing protein [Marmoricola sp.]
MSSLRIRYTSALAVLAGLLVVMTGLVGPAQAATARSVSISASPSSAYGGSKITYSGTVSHTGSGQVVRLQRKNGASWINVTSATTTSGGAYTVKSNLNTPAGTYTFRTAAPASGSLATAFSHTVDVTSLGVNPNTPVITTTSLPDADKGVAYSQPLTKTGGDGTWSVSAGALPAGITLGSSTGTLSGTPTAGGTATFTVKFTQTADDLSDTQALTLVVTPAPTVTSPTTLPAATRAVAYSTTLTHSGKAGTWSVPANSLPAGLSLNSATGTLSGTPTVVGTFGIYPTFTETSTGRTAFKALSLTINGTALAITTATLPSGTQGTPYSVTLAENGGPGTWSQLGLPEGLSLNPTTGEISGNPAESGDFSVYVGFTETSTSSVATKAYALHLNAGSVPPGYPTITTTSLPNGSKGAPYSATLTKTGGAGTWSRTAGILPPGVTLDTATGAFSGTPTAAGSFGFTVRFTETATGHTVSKTLAIYVDAGPKVTTTSLPDAHVGQPYSVTLTKTGEDGTWSSLDLPEGLTLDETTGTLSGTPTTGGVYPIYVAFTETDSGNYATANLSLTVIAPVITTTTVPDGTTGTAYSQQLAKTGLAGTFEQTAGFLPDGITLSPGGLLSGTPTQAGDYGFTVTFTETSTGASDKQAYLLHVSDPGSPVISTASQLPDGTVGTAYTTTLAATPTGGTWSITYGSLPLGLSLNASTGVISGTPSFPDPEIFIAKYTKGATSNTKAFSLTTKAAPKP